MCLFHKWDLWEIIDERQYLRQLLNVQNTVVDEYPVTLLIQQRRCSKCGKIQIRKERKY